MGNSACCIMPLSDEIKRFCTSKRGEARRTKRTHAPQKSPQAERRVRAPPRRPWEPRRCGGRPRGSGRRPPLPRRALLLLCSCSLACFLSTGLWARGLPPLPSCLLALSLSLSLSLFLSAGLWAFSLSLSLSPLSLSLSLSLSRSFFCFGGAFRKARSAAFTKSTSWETFAGIWCEARGARLTTSRRKHDHRPTAGPPETPAAWMDACNYREPNEALPMTGLCLSYKAPPWKGVASHTGSGPASREDDSRTLLEHITVSKLNPPDVLAARPVSVSLGICGASLGSHAECAGVCSVFGTW